MQAIREIQSVQKHQVVVNLPESFTAKRVEVIVIPYEEMNEDRNIMLAQQPSMQDWENEDDEVWDNVPAI
jgi:hypothetical protein